MSYDMTEDTPQGTKFTVKQSVAGEKSVDSQPAASSMPVAHAGDFVDVYPELGRPVYRFFKRALDIVFSGCVIAVAAIPSAVLAAAIRLESPGNPFYSQERMGRLDKDGRLTTFRMWKFRSMYKDADERLAELLDKNEIKGAMFKMKDDPRVTKIGHFIRKHSIAPVKMGALDDGEPTNLSLDPDYSSLVLPKCERRAGTSQGEKRSYLSLHFLSYVGFESSKGAPGQSLSARRRAPISSVGAAV